MRYFLSLFVLLLCHAAYSKDIKICSISIAGNKVTRSAVILREIGIHEGDIVEADSVASIISKNKLRLFNLGLFNEVEQRTDIDSEGLHWYIAVKERWYIVPAGTLQFAEKDINNWWVNGGHDLRRVTAGLTLTDNNFRGNLELLTATIQAGFNEKIGLSYMRPYVNKHQTSGIGFSASYQRSREVYYTTSSDKLLFIGDYTGPVMSQQAEAGISYMYRPGYASKHTVQLGYKDHRISDTILELNADYYADGKTRARFMELLYRYEYNGVDNWNYSLHGYKLVSVATLRQGFEGINFQAFVNVEAGVFKELFSKTYASAIFRGRLMYPDKQPYFYRGGLGMQKDYVRGYEYYVADGYNYGVARVNLKRQILNNTFSTGIKYFSAVPARVYFKVFFDAGYINNPVPITSAVVNKPLYSMGAGVDIVTLYDVKIRIEFARNHLSENGIYLHFNSE